MIGQSAEVCRIERRFELGDDVIGTGLAVLGGEIGKDRSVTPGPHLDGYLDLGRVSSDLGTSLLQHADLVAEQRGVAAGQIPLIGPSGSDAEAAMLAGAVELDRREFIAKCRAFRAAIGW